MNLLKNAKISYNDGNKNKKESYDNYSQGNSKGAWITLSNNGFLVSLNESDGTYYKSLDQTIYNNDEIIYLIGGNWKNSIYMTDPEGNNKKELLVM